MEAGRIRQVPVNGEAQLRYRVRGNDLDGDGRLVGTTFWDVHTRAVVLGCVGVVVDGLFVGATVDGLIGTIAGPDDVGLGAPGFAFIVVRHVFTREPIVPAHRVIDVLTLAIIRARAVVDGGVGVVVEGKWIGATLRFHFNRFTSDAEGDGLEVTGFECKCAQRQILGWDADLDGGVVPPVAEAVDHFQLQTAGAVTQAERSKVFAVIRIAFALGDHAVGIGQNERHFTPPQGGVQGHQHFCFSIGAGQNAHARPVIVRCIRVVIERFGVGATEHRLVIAVAVRHNKGTHTLRLTRIGEGDQFAGGKI